MPVGRKPRGLFRRSLAGLLLLLAPLAAGSGPAAPPPPPPVWRVVPNDFQVVALWDHSQPRGPIPALAAAPPLAGDLTLISKSASPASVAVNGTLHYAITLTNTTNVTQTFQVTDTLPADLAYITPTVNDDFVYSAATHSLLTTTRSLNAFQGDVITATGAPPYHEIVTDTAAANICQTYFSECDDNAITLVGVPFTYFGVDYNSITLDSNGFVRPGSGAVYTDSVNQNLPSAAAPNTVIAPFWANLDLDGKSPVDTGGGDWLYAHVIANSIDYLVVEWHNAQKNGVPGTAYSFQVWIQYYVEHITFAYDTPAFTGGTSSGTIGFENSDGTLGDSYLFNTAITSPGPMDGAKLGLVTDFDTTHLGFDAKGLPGLPGCSTITNTVELARPTGTLTTTALTATATTATFGRCLLLPLIAR